MLRKLFFPDAIAGGGAPATTTPAAAAAGGTPAAKPAATEPGPSNRDSTHQPGRDNPFDAVDKKVAAAAKPAAKADGVPTGKPGDKPADGAAPDPLDTVKDPKELRKRLKEITGEHNTAKSSMAELQKKIAEYEAKGKDTTALTDQMTALNKEMETLRAENRALKQEASPEFKAKYEEPFNLAAEYAKDVISKMTKADGSPATFDGDFASLYRMPYNKAYAQAREMFGDDAPIVMEQIRDLHKLEFAKSQAFEKEKATWKENQTKAEANAAAQKEQINAAWASVNKELSENVAEYHDAPEEKEYADLRKEGLAVFDSAPKTMQQKIVKDAHVRQRMGAYFVLKLKNERQASQIADLQAALAEAKGSAPGDTRRTDLGADGGSESWKDELRKNRSQFEQPA